MLEHPSMGDTDGMQAPLSDSALPWAHASHRSDEPMEEEGEEQEHSERQTAHWRRRRNEQRHRTLVEQDAERAGEGTDIAAAAAAESPVERESELAPAFDGYTLIQAPCPP